MKTSCCKYAWLLVHNMQCFKSYLNAWIPGGRKNSFLSSLGSHNTNCLKRPSLYCLIHFYKRYLSIIWLQLSHMSLILMGWWKPHEITLTYNKVLPLASLKVHIQKTLHLPSSCLFTPASQKPAAIAWEGRTIWHTYLAWRLTMIMKVVPLGWDLSIALRFGWPLRLPQMWVTRTRNFW